MKNLRLSATFQDESLVVEAVKPHASSKKVVEIKLSNGEYALASIAKHYDDDEPLFCDPDTGVITPGWTIEGGWVVSPNSGGGLTAGGGW